MFEDVFTTHRHGNISYNTPAETYRPSPRYNVLKEVNRNELRYYALLALAKNGLLSPRCIRESEFLEPEAPKPAKTFTVTVYGEDIGHKYGNQVMFANEKDLNTLMKIMEDMVGEERMGMIKKSISTKELDDVQKVGLACYKKWAAGIDWPLAQVG